LHAGDRAGTPLAPSISSASRATAIGKIMVRNLYKVMSEFMGLSLDT
jgi:hypothetical protein